MPRPPLHELGKNRGLSIAKSSTSFAECIDLRRRYPLGAYARIPGGAVGRYSYLKRLTQGRQQFLAGSRKFAPPYLDRSDLMALIGKPPRFPASPTSWTRTLRRWTKF